MALKVRFMSGLSGLTGAREVFLEGQYGSLRDVIDEVLDRYPVLRGEIFDPDSVVDFMYQILLNGRNVTAGDWGSTRVRDGDEVVFLAILGGGSHG